MGRTARALEAGLGPISLALEAVTRERHNMFLASGLGRPMTAVSRNPDGVLAAVASNPMRTTADHRQPDPSP